METQLFFPNSLLLEWFDSQKRSLPWREEATPYRVWVSEVMLQQTRVAVVIDYFERWMVTFPTIASLAEAPPEKVLKMWEGLGYYSRARNLHAGAKQCMEEFGGSLPSDEESLFMIKGLGPYTVAALLNFAFHKKKAVIDGNVLRVMSRFFAIEKSIDLSDTRKVIVEKIDAFLPENEFWKVSEALIELGALVCTKEPKCILCPLQNHCAARNLSLEHTLPIRKARKKIIPLRRLVKVVVCENKVALLKVEKGKIMADLYEFPYDDITAGGEEKILLSEKELVYVAPLESVRHHFTHYKVDLFPHLFLAKKCTADRLWVDKDRLVELPFSSGHRRILENLIENLTYRSLCGLGRARDQDCE